MRLISVYCELRMGRVTKPQTRITFRVALLLYSTRFWEYFVSEANGKFGFV